MTPPFTHEIEDTEFEAADGSLVGAARYYVDAETDFSADVGGVDGPAIASCGLSHVKVGNLILTREQLVLAFGEPAVADQEARARAFFVRVIGEAA